MALKSWWANPTRRWLVIGGFAYAWFFSQGIPLWDDDFTSWFWKIKDRSLFALIWEWINPISTQPQYWGFNERPLQAMVFKFFNLISGYESWSFFLFKSAVYAGLGLMIYQWSLRLVPNGSAGSRAALAAAVFFLLTPGPMAAHILHQDFAPVAELIFLTLTYFIWEGIEKTPTSWVGLPSLKDPEQKKWVIRWTVLSVLTYLGYKSKADLKMIPVILAFYVLLVRRKQWKLFSIPVALMVFLAVPWGKAIFQKLPPFVPGSGGSEIGWMWQPASLERMREFIISSAPFDFLGSLRAATISLGGLWGPFLLFGLLVFLLWRSDGKLDKVPWTRTERPEDRARVFAFIWFGVILLATSALPAINYTFRIRYGILTMVPASLVLAWAFGLFSESSSKLPRWAVYIGIALFVVQTGINLNRSIAYRRDMGQVMVAVDQAYEHVQNNYANEQLTLLPDFRPYDYRPDAGPAFAKKEWLGSGDDLVRKHKPLRTYVISWNPSLWDQLELVEHFTGCRQTSLFDRIFPCAKGSGTYLMRYIGQDSLYAEGENLRSKGDIAGARRLHEEFLAKYPKSLAAQFVLGLEAYQQRDWLRSAQAYSVLENYFPTHLSILYNHALALSELQKYPEAIARLKYVAAKDPQNYAVLINLYWSHAKAGQKKDAKKLLLAMKDRFPNHAEVNRLLATSE